MITFKPVVFAHHKRQDGTFNVKIRITYNRQVRYLPTTLWCTSADLTRGFKLKNNTLIARSQELCNEMRTACADLTLFDLENRDVDFVVDHIKRSLEQEAFHLDFFAWSDEYLNTKTPTTRRNYISALNALERFIGCRELDINSISHPMMMDFVEYVDNAKKMHYDHKSKTWVEGKSEKVSKGASSIYIMKLAHIFNSAKEKYNDEDTGRIVIPRSPFDKIRRYFPPAHGQKNLGVEVMQTIISAQVDDEPTRTALDAFIVSFALMGANMADLYFAVPFKGNVWVYNRTKTRSRRDDHAEMRVDIPVQIKPHLQRLQAKRGAWWLPALHELNADKDRCTARVNNLLRIWAEANDIEPFTFYAGRHTWASLARKAGVEKAVVDECLVHVGDFKMTDIYAERDWNIINEANQKVLALFDFTI